MSRARAAGVSPTKASRFGMRAAQAGVRFPQALALGGERRRISETARVEGERPFVLLGQMAKARHRRAFEALVDHLVEGEQAALRGAPAVREVDRRRVHRLGDRARSRRLSRRGRRRNSGRRAPRRAPHRALRPAPMAPGMRAAGQKRASGPGVGCRRARPWRRSRAAAPPRRGQAGPWPAWPGARQAVREPRRRIRSSRHIRVG